MSRVVAVKASPAEHSPALLPQARSDVASDLVAAPVGWKIESVRTVGSGCPMSGPPAVVWISPEGDELDVELGVEVDVTQMDARPADSANCTLVVAMRVPAGYAYAPTQLRVGGRAFLPAGTQATLLTTYGFQGSGLSSQGITQRVTSPSSLEAFDFVDDFANAPLGLQWSRCGEQQALSVSMVLHVQNSAVKQRAWAALSYATGLRFTWKRCA